ncbi:ubiquitin-like protein 4A isoform X1 [Diaphorina citri]|uniref:Ubiquitin-like protein 4A isoform X1 n=1 Tax=Diaphorina citri TaxID=121845 RepID=A0A1S4E8Z8_DIACI|nr:ubiquitin-like protein 4A isoform X2 [Diaphorina citri]XP_017298669.1 ubiquitin-like protein 4A isoform X1 [Diaphorina citri]XP_017298670.1 ubiquitin-like protein 4A isoform X1 [Diaphorina citri]XP_017298671.1 ubiquitin-like protein 4A isoform X1 [Diaphorina citri]XP_017298672.1 ubiquitin-like protein 4A isoform X2 [Diaphorina citri]XP_017298673.1 ubiquitin-like protein 4A isoform X1 [Diaphorina citri]XP_017298674.1 ubiquitin-like protein 4A isoform X1 [Diaphorina citri]KAI5713455.1 hypot
MKISVKVLQGQEIFLDVNSEMSILELKNKINEALKIPVSDQKLLATGRPLLDTKQILDYPQIKEGTKLNLVVKRALKESSQSVAGGSNVTILRDASYKFLRKYFTETQSNKIADEFIKEFNKSISTLSLDDLEALASSYLMEEECQPVAV